MKNRARVLAVAVTVAAMAVMSVIVTACSDSDDGDSTKAGTPRQTKPTSAAAKPVSLYATNDTKPLVTPLLAAFNKAARGITVRVTFVTFESLASAVERGLADVVITGGPAMRELDDQVGIDADPRLLGWDEMVIAVAPGNPKGISSVSVFGEDATTSSVICSRRTSCGLWTERVLESTNITPAADHVSDTPIQMLKDVAALRTDAALLKRTTAALAPTKVQQIAIQAERNVRLAYRLAVVDATGTAVRFATFATSVPAKNALMARGYLPQTPVDVDLPDSL